jgi:hypothetical protein
MRITSPNPKHFMRFPAAMRHRKPGTRSEPSTLHNSTLNSRYPINIIDTLRKSTLRKWK